MICPICNHKFEFTNNFSYCSEIDPNDGYKEPCHRCLFKGDFITDEPCASCIHQFDEYEVAPYPQKNDDLIGEKW